MTCHDKEMPNRTLADISDREQICAVDNAPDNLGYMLVHTTPPPGTLKYIKVKQNLKK